MITEDAVDFANNFLWESAEDVGNAKAEAFKWEHMLKHTKALAMKHSGETTISGQEREAFLTEQYVTAVDKAAEAAGRYETLRAKREAAAMTIETWRSQGANYRAMKL